MTPHKINIPSFMCFKNYVILGKSISVKVSSPEIYSLVSVTVITSVILELMGGTYILRVIFLYI